MVPEDYIILRAQDFVVVGATMLTHTLTKDEFPDEKGTLIRTNVCTYDQELSSASIVLYHCSECLAKPSR